MDKYHKLKLNFVKTAGLESTSGFFENSPHLIKVLFLNKKFLYDEAYIGVPLGGTSGTVPLWTMNFGHDLSHKLWPILYGP